jgi:hypothetical protein
MTDENSILQFYKHSNDKEQIGWKTCMARNTVGPNLQQLFNVLFSQGLSQRAHIYQQEGGWTGDLYVVHRRLFQFQNEISRFMGDSGAGGPLVANVYDVTMNSTEGWAQYLSLVLKGPYNEEVAQKLTNLDFAPKHSDLAKDDRVSRTASNQGLWLDDIVEFPSVMPRE